jgi:mannose-6-phosphate isomerase-like protein (cupin superfamily)
MSSYTHLNLREVEDVAPRFGYTPNLESRFARTALELQNSGVSYFKIAPDYRVPFGHNHSEQEEIYVIARGSARMKVGDDVVELREMDALRVPPGTPRGIEAGPDGAELIAFGAPNTDNKDAEVLPEWWSD